MTCTHIRWICINMWVLKRGILTVEMTFLSSAPWQLSQWRPEKQVRGLCITFLRPVHSTAMLTFPLVENSSVYLPSPSLCVCTYTVSAMHVMPLFYCGFLGNSYLYNVHQSHTLASLCALFVANTVHANAKT